jgi:predicted secreted hydrolase
MTVTRRWIGIWIGTAVGLVAALLLVPTETSVSAQTPAGADWLGTVATLPGESFERPAGDWRLDLPKDHGSHPESFSETWQFTVHLQGAGNAPVGIQFSLFRIGLLPPDAPATESLQPRHLYRGHVIVTDTGRSAVYAEERFGRGLDGLAGYDGRSHELRLDNWTIRFTEASRTGNWQLRASAGDGRVDLVLRPAREPLSVDAAEAPFRGYAVSRFHAEGVLETSQGEQPLSGLAWFEHLWGELPIPGESPVVSDRLQVQLDDGTDLAVIRSRRIDGGGTPTIEAFLIGADGQATPLGDESASIEITRHWQGHEGSWPIGWALRLDDLELSVMPVLDDQEHAFVAPTWSGLVQAEGRRGNRALSGMGTLQSSGTGLP